MKSIAIFASGSGSNTENLIRFFRTNPVGQVKLVMTNRSDAYVIKRVQSFDIEVVVFDREQFYETGEVLSILKNRHIEFIILAGFLWLVPDLILKNFEGRVVNIHPALLPKYGGKGMYGQRVHEAVISNHDTESGITIHHVNQKYDEGNIIFQATCKVESSDTPDSLAEKIHALEFLHFPTVVERLIHQL